MIRGGEEGDLMKEKQSEDDTDEEEGLSGWTGTNWSSTTAPD